MRVEKTGNNQYLKEMNQSLVLDLIRTVDGMSRKSLADRTGLSATATGAIVGKLLNDKYIREVGEGASSGGRKPVILEINPDSYYAFGFDIDSRFIYTVVLDITGKMHYKNKLEINGPLTPDDAVKQIAGIFKTVVSKLKIKKERILGAGVSIPGMLDIKTRRITLAPNLGWSDTDILSSLKAQLNIPVSLDNEAMCSAFCENWLGICKGIEDFICINIESGIGAGIFIGGNIYRGYSGSAGEVGHISVDENGPKCKCGNIGCLETVASINAMVLKYGELAGHTGKLNDLDNENFQFEGMLKLAIDGDEKSFGIFKDAAISLGKAVGYLINAFNPQQIVIGKKFPQYADLILDEIRYAAEKTALREPAGNCRILASRFGEDSSAVGAAIIPIRKLFGR